MTPRSPGEDAFPDPVTKSDPASASESESPVPESHAESLAEARRRLEAVRGLRGEHHPEYAAALNQLALLLVIHGVSAEAEPLLRQALAIRRAALGADHPDYATSLSSLAGLLWAAGDLDEAEPLLVESLEVRRRVLGADHPRTAASQRSLDELRATRAEQEAAVHEHTAASVDTAVHHLASSTHSTNGTHLPNGQAGGSQARPILTPASAPDTDLPGTPPGAPPPGEAEAATGSSNDLSHELLVMTEVFDDLSDHLVAAAVGLRGQGVPPDQGLIAELSSSLHEFNSLRERTCTLAGTLRVACPPLENLAGLEDLGLLLDAIAEAELGDRQDDQVRHRCLSILDRVLRLTLPGDEGRAALQACQDQARALLQQLNGGSSTPLPAEAVSMADGDHAFCHLLSLVQDGDELSDDLWARLLDSVNTAFGEPLAAAAARGELSLPEEPPSLTAD